MVKALKLEKLTPEECQIVDDNISLVVWQVNRYAGKDSQYYWDYIQEGCMGLIVAVKRYDARHERPLAAYASSMIKWYLDRFRLKQCGKVGYHVGRKIRELNKAFVYYRSVGKMPTDKELLEKTKLSGLDQSFLDGYDAICSAKNIQSVFVDSGKTRTREPILLDLAYEAIDNAEFVKYVFDRLDDEVKVILTQYYLKGRTLDNIALEHHCTGENIRLKVNKALEKARRVASTCR